VKRQENEPNAEHDPASGDVSGGAGLQAPASLLPQHRKQIRKSDPTSTATGHSCPASGSNHTGHQRPLCQSWMSTVAVRHRTFSATTADMGVLLSRCFEKKSSKKTPEEGAFGTSSTLAAKSHQPRQP